MRHIMGVADGETRASKAESALRIAEMRVSAG
jgi:hypothetical protein